MAKRTFNLLILMFLASCQTGPSTRELSPSEMQRYQLNGVIHDAKICPNEFNEKSQALRVSGPCEIINCDQMDSKIKCRATTENP